MDRSCQVKEILDRVLQLKKFSVPLFQEPTNHRMAMSLKACPWQFPMQTRTCAIKGDAEKPWTSILPFPHKAKTEPNPNSVPEHSAQVERVLFGP